LIACCSESVNNDVFSWLWAGLIETSPTFDEKIKEMYYHLV